MSEVYNARHRKVIQSKVDEGCSLVWDHTEIIDSLLFNFSLSRDEAEDLLEEYEAEYEDLNDKHNFSFYL